MKGTIILKASLILLSLFTFVLSLDAAPITWTGAGADNLASNPSNWLENAAPYESDDVIFDSTSPTDCSWDLNLTLSSLALNLGYTGTVTLNSPLIIAGDMIISDGQLFLNQNLSIVVPLPTATAVQTTDLNGNSATLSASVNPNGSQTTVYFECGTDSSYELSTSPQSIGGGTSDVNVTADISNLLPNTSYHCRVVVTNAGGTIYGNDTNFTTPPIILTVISPVSGSSVNRPDIMVRGTLTNSTGNETGVSINGMTAVFYNNEFYFNHVPLEDGSNIITVNAVDTAGNTVAVSKSVNSDTTAPHVTLKTNIDSGSSPLTTYSSVSTSIPNEITNYQIDFEGDGLFDYSDSVFDNISHTYTGEGVYFPTLSITDDQDIIYTDTIAVVVLPITGTDALLKAKWNNMKALLASQNISGALQNFSDESVDLYNELFSALHDQLPQIAQGMQDIQLINIVNNAAKYRIKRSETHGGQSGDVSYFIYFERDNNGLWKIKRF